MGEEYANIVERIVMTPAQFRKLTISKTAELLGKLGHRFEAKPGAKLENKKFVTYWTIDGKLVKAADIYKLYFKGRTNLSLARARQLSMTKRGVSLAGGDSMAWQKAANHLLAASTAVSNAQASVKACAKAMPTKGAGSDVDEWGAALIKIGNMLRSGIADLKDLAKEADE